MSEHTVVSLLLQRTAEVPFATYKRQQAALARRRLYPLTLFYTMYAILVLAIAFSTTHPWIAVAFFFAGCAAWTLVEYLFHRYVLHGRFRRACERRVVSRRLGFCIARNTCAAIALVFLFWGNTAFAQNSSEDAPRPIVAPKPVPPSEQTSSAQIESDLNEGQQSSSVSTSLDASSLGSTAEAKQSKRILWIFPNYRAVSADTQLPPLSLKDKFWLATQDSFDYSSFASAGMLAGVSQANKSYPEFGQGAKGYGRYFWHAVADQAVGNYLTEAIVPAVTHEDPRYYTLGHGGFFKRTAYAVSRLLVTRTDSGHRTINLSEIVGNGAGAGISDLYYPSRERTWTKTGQKWVTQIALDGVFNIAKEFWPNINHAIFHGKY